jgi:hypothetical protein
MEIKPIDRLMDTSIQFGVGTTTEITPIKNEGLKALK